MEKTCAAQHPHAWRILPALLLFAAALRLPAVFIPHIENDEVIYRTLAEKLTVAPADYSIRNTPIFERLPKSQYDHPVFRHPPLFFYLLALIYKLWGAESGIFLPLGCAIAIIALCYLISRRLYSEREALLAAAILSLCPLLFLTSTRLWLETPCAALTTLSFYLFIRAYDRRHSVMIAASGFTLGLALLTKYSAAGIIPAIIVYALLRKDTLQCAPTIIIFLASMILPLAPWLAYYHHAMGTFSAAVQFKATRDFLEMFPFVKASFNKPLHFYLSQLALTAPVYIFALAALPLCRKKENAALIVWTASYIIGFTILFKLKILGCALRYILPASIPLAILSAHIILKRPRFLLPVAIVFLASQLVCGLLNSYIFLSADVFSTGWFIKNLTWQ